MNEFLERGFLDCFDILDTLPPCCAPINKREVLRKTWVKQEKYCAARLNSDSNRGHFASKLLMLAHLFKIEHHK